MSEGRGLDPTDRASAIYWAGTDCSGHDHGRTTVPGATSPLEIEVAGVFGEAMRLLLGRHRDYGPRNISNGYPDPITALIVRSSDKLERIKNLNSKGGTDTYGERARDSWIDLANYSLIACLVMDGKWPGIDISARNSQTPLSKENHGPLGSNP